VLLCVHTNLKDVAALAASTEHARFGATTCVKLIDQRNGLYRLEATDGRVLAVVQGPDGRDDAARDNPLLGSEDLAPEVFEALIPAEDFKHALGLDKKARLVAVSAQEHDLRFFTLTQQLAARQGEGRFPEVGRVIPDRLPLFSVRVSIKLFQRILKLFQGFCAEGAEAVALHYHGKNAPLGFTARNAETGQTLDALLVPLTDTPVHPG
jgi:hypothetical protein